MKEQQQRQQQSNLNAAQQTLGRQLVWWGTPCAHRTERTQAKNGGLNPWNGGERKQRPQGGHLQAQTSEWWKFSLSMPSLQSTPKPHIQLQIALLLSSLPLTGRSLPGAHFLYLSTGCGVIYKQEKKNREAREELWGKLLTHRALNTQLWECC